MKACLMLGAITCLTVLTAAECLTFDVVPQVATRGENITAIISGGGDGETCAIVCQGIKCNDIVHCAEATACVNMTLDPSGHQTAIFETHGVGHITLVAKCSSGSTDLFVELSVGSSRVLSLISVIVGWIYFCAWSASFYPQILTNYRRKSVVGLNFDFLALNLVGFSCYSIFNICLYFVPAFRLAYKAEHPFSSIPVELNDVVFAVHAVAVTIVTVIQCACVYERGNQKLAIWSILFISVAAFIAIVLLVLVLTDRFSKLDYIYYFSYVKLIITIIKYIPQAHLNFLRKSTIGWSIGNILLDFTGGSLSILQMVLLSANFDDWKSIFGNPTKFGLGLFSILFDLLFLTQHFILYRHVVPDELFPIMPASTT